MVVLLLVLVPSSLRVLSPVLALPGTLLLSLSLLLVLLLVQANASRQQPQRVIIGIGDFMPGSYHVEGVM
jgi:hypothetical protein